MIVHPAIKILSDLAIPRIHESNAKTSQILESNQYQFCKDLMQNIVLNHESILSVIARENTKNNFESYEDLISYLSVNIEKESLKDFLKKFSEYLLFTFFSSEEALCNMDIPITTNEIEIALSKANSYHDLLPQ